MKTKQSLKPPTLRSKDDDALGYVMMLVGLFLTFFFLNVFVLPPGERLTTPIDIFVDMFITAANWVANTIAGG